ncbi:MAG: alpha/beta hydrolase fold domain-containing protein [Acidobacteriota bacterium]
MTRIFGAGPHADAVRTLLERRPFRCHRWLRSGHGQTIIGSQQRRRFEWGWSSSVSERILLPDGVAVDALWVEVDRSAPTLVAVHGMSGSNRSLYMLGLSHKAYLRGWNSLLLDLYDRSESRRIFHAGCSSEVRAIIEAFRSSKDLADILIAGVSMGGNIVLKLAGEAGARPPAWLRGVGVISPLVDLTASWHLMDRRSNWLYRHYYVRRLKKLTQRNLVHLRDEIDVERLRRVRSIRQFDEVVTVPLAGFADVSDYYRRASAAPWLEQIATPALAIHASDDPFLPAEPLLRKELARHQALCVALTDHGGHVAFIEDRCVDLDRSWAENRLIEFFALLV